MSDSISDSENLQGASVVTIVPVVMPVSSLEEAWPRDEIVI
jgi:hypothetical protein